MGRPSLGRWLLPLLMALGAGCEASVDAPPAGTPTSGDPSVPRLLSSSPADGSSGVPLAGSLYLEFSVPVDTAALELAVEPPVAFDAPLWSHGDLLLELHLAQPLRPDSRYRVSISGRSAQGQPFAAPSVFSFSTADGATPRAQTQSTGAAPPAPDNLRAITGGDSIAIRWDPVPGAAQYDVYRDDARFAGIPASSDSLFPIFNGVGFVDRGVAAGRSYVYWVRALTFAGAASEPSPSLLVQHPALSTAVPVISTDASGAPELRVWLEQTVKPFLETWYPKVADQIARPDYVPAAAFSVVLDPVFGDAVYLSGDRLMVGAGYARAHPTDLGAYLSASILLLTQVKDGTPEWISTGIAVWARQFVLRDQAPVAPTVGDHYENGGADAAYFFNAVEMKYGSGLVRRLNVAAHQGNYNSNLFKAQTTKSVGTLWSEMTGRPLPGPLKWHDDTLSGLCVEQGSFANIPNAVTLQKCKDEPRQRWGLLGYTDGTVSVLQGKQCVDLQGGALTNGVRLVMNACDARPSQRWSRKSNGQLVNVAANRCFDDPGFVSTPPVHLELWECFVDGPAQRLDFPY